MPRPTIGLTCGDPAGVGPELVCKVLADRALRERVRFVVFGPLSVRDAVDAPSPDLEWVETDPADRWGSWEMGRAQAACGHAALAALRAGHVAALAGRVDALVTAPVSKEALHLAGERVEGQTELLSRWTGTEAEMMAIAGDLRVLLLTRHLALREALERIDSAAVESHLRLLDETLRTWGWRQPRLALAGLNPHAGEGGLFGDEEERVLVPALEAARSRGIDVSGPLSPDTVFARAHDGAFDAVLALYHDQAFLPVKIIAPSSALTVLCGLPYLRISPAHGTAFDIAGRGLASAENLLVAVHEAGAWIERRGPRRSGDQSAPVPAPPPDRASAAAAIEAPSG